MVEMVNEHSTWREKSSSHFYYDYGNERGNETWRGDKKMLKRHISHESSCWVQLKYRVLFFFSTAENTHVVVRDGNERRLSALRTIGPSIRVSKHTEQWNEDVCESFWNFFVDDYFLMAFSWNNNSRTEAITFNILVTSDENRRKWRKKISHNTSWDDGRKFLIFFSAEIWWNWLLDLRTYMTRSNFRRYFWSDFKFPASRQRFQAECWAMLCVECETRV